jgi:hypothetical protein
LFGIIVEKKNDIKDQKFDGITIDGLLGRTLVHPFEQKQFIMLTLSPHPKLKGTFE